MKQVSTRITVIIDDVLHALPGKTSFVCLDGRYLIYIGFISTCSFSIHTLIFQTWSVSLERKKKTELGHLNCSVKTAWFCSRKTTESAALIKEKKENHWVSTWLFCCCVVSSGATSTSQLRSFSFSAGGILNRVFCGDGLFSGCFSLFSLFFERLWGSADDVLEEEEEEAGAPSQTWGTDQSRISAWKCHMHKQKDEILVDVQFASLQRWSPRSPSRPQAPSLVLLSQASSSGSVWWRSEGTLRHGDTETWIKHLRSRYKTIMT